MQGSINVSLQTAPLVPINVVVSSNSSSVLLSKSSTTVGASSVTFSSVTSSSIGTIYVQGQPLALHLAQRLRKGARAGDVIGKAGRPIDLQQVVNDGPPQIEIRSEEHTSELQSL